MFLRVAGHAQAEIGVQFLQQRDDIGAEVEAVLERGCRRQSVGHVATQGHDVADSLRVMRLCDGRDLCPGVVDRSEMRHDREAEFLPQETRHLGRALPRASPRAVGHGHEIRSDAPQCRRGLTQGLDPRLILGREELERAQRAPLREEFGDRPV